MSSKKQVVVDLKILSSEAAKNISDLTVKIANLSKTMEGMRAAGLSNSEQYHKLEAVMKDLKQTVKANEKALVEGVKQQKSSGDSINSMRAQLKLLRQEYEDLSKVQREGTQGNQLLTDIDNLTTEIKKLEFAQQDFSRQVGEYDVLTQPARTALREMRMECQNLAVALDATNGKIQAQETIVQNLAATVGTENQEYADAVAELDRLNKAYEETSQKLSEMEQKTGELADTVADSNKRIAAFANDEQRFAAMQEGVNALGAAFTAVQGSMALLGVESKSLLEVYAKIQIVQQTLNSLMTIYKALNKDSNLMIALRVNLEKVRLTWTKAYNAALAKQNGTIAANTAAETANAAATAAAGVAETAATATTFSLTAAFAALNAVLKANPIIAIASAIILGITGIVAVVKKLSKANKEAAEQEKKNAEQLKENSEKYAKSVKERAGAVESVTKKYDEQIAKIRTYLAVLRNEASAYDTKKRALRELTALMPKYNGQLTQSGKFIEGNIKIIDDYIAKLKQKAQAEAYTEMLTQTYLKQASANREKIQMESDKKWYEKRIEFNKAMEEGARAANDWETVATAQKNLDYYERKLEETTSALKKVDNEIKEANKDIATTEKLVTDLGIMDTAPTTSRGSTSVKSESVDDGKKEVEDARKMYEELQSIAREYYAELNKLGETALDERIRKENDRYMKELSALVDAYNHSIDLLNKGDDFLTKAGLDPDAVRRYSKEMSDAMDEATKRNKDNVQKIKDDWQKALDEVAQKTNASYNDLTEKLRNELARDGKSGIELLRMRLSQELDALEKEKEAELAAHEYTEEQKYEISRLYAEKRNKLVKNEAKQEKKVWIDNVQTTLSAMQDVTGAFSSLFSVMAEGNEKYQKYANALALVDIMTNMAVGIASAVAKGMEMGWPAAAIMIPVGIAAVVSGIASAISLFKQNDKVGSAPKFAEGGLVGNKTTRRKDDSVEARLTLGEYVIPTDVVSDLGVDFFDGLIGRKRGWSVPKLRFAEGGLVSAPLSTPQVLTSSVEAALDYESVKDAMKEAVMEMPAPVVSVKEVTNAQKRVRVKENTARS